MEQKVCGRHLRNVKLSWDQSQDKGFFADFNSNLSSVYIWINNLVKSHLEAHASCETRAAYVGSMSFDKEESFASTSDVCSNLLVWYWCFSWRYVTSCRSKARSSIWQSHAKTTETPWFFTLTDRVAQWLVDVGFHDRCIEALIGARIAS
jgi:hypothetical protein